jgi:LytS/YehU family sensor histidine kinase
MLLIPFVENAFKHGSLVEGFLRIEIKVTMGKNRLDFSIRNTFTENEKEINGGIGLENIRKRLELNYKENYNLNILNEGKWYVAELSIFNLNLMQND